MYSVDDNSGSWRLCFKPWILKFDPQENLPTYGVPPEDYPTFHSSILSSEIKTFQNRIVRLKKIIATADSHQKKKIQDEINTLENLMISMQENLKESNVTHVLVPGENPKGDEELEREANKS